MGMDSDPTSVLSTAALTKSNTCVAYRLSFIQGMVVDYQTMVRNSQEWDRNIQ